METLEKIKVLRSIEGVEQDAVLKIMIEDANSSIKEYCHIKAVPERLEYIVRELVLATIDKDNGGNVASIKRGDTQINYTTSITADSFSAKQRNVLNGYRKLRIG